MIHNVSLLDEIKKGGYDASLISTFNAYLPFYEEIVLRKLQSAGIRHNVLLMDAKQCRQSLHAAPPRFAGYHYSLVPMASAGAFHPKIILLLGKKKGLLCIGSHNMTLAGFGFNREVSNVISLTDTKDKETIALFVAAWKCIQGWMAEQQAPEQLAKMVKKVVSFAPWLKEKNAQQPGNAVVIASMAGTSSLWQQLLDVIQGPVSRAIVLGAFFDGQLQFITRLQQDLAPRECFVGIDPESVQAPDSLRSHEGIRVLNIDKNLGKIENREAGYLHAKCLVLQTEDGQTYLVSGSANPSAPAWLKPGFSGNTEMMLVRRGEEAEAATRELGLFRIPDMPELQSEDWETVTERWQEAKIQRESDRSQKLGMALAVDEGLRIMAELPEESRQYDYKVLNSEQQLIDTPTVDLDDERLLPLSVKIKDQARFVFGEFNGIHQITLLVFHPQKIQKLSRSDTQRQFREALGSLGTETPQLAELLKHVEKIIFPKKQETDSTTSGLNAQRKSPSKVNKESASDGTGTLAIDIGETRKSQKKHRLHSSGELADILDAFIYHIGTETDSNIPGERKDSKGRTEEEQVGAEDEDERISAVLLEREGAEEPLEICHKKVKQLVRKMGKQLDDLKKGKASLERVVVCLSGVLAVLHYLRKCDGHVSWVQPGQTSIPVEERRRLLQAAVSSLCEGSYAPLFPKEADEAIIHSDEFAILHGLLLWLARDCDISLKLRTPYRETQQEFRERLSQNSLLLPLIQLIQDDEVVIEEARNRIRELSSGELDWLDRILKISQRLQQIELDSEELRPGREAKAGDIATNIRMPYFGFRVVRDSPEKVVYFGEKKQGKFSKEVIKVLPQKIFPNS